MNRVCFPPRAAAALALSAALLLPLSAASAADAEAEGAAEQPASQQNQDAPENQDVQENQDAQQDREAQKDQVRQLRVFELKHRQPQELIQIIGLRATGATGQPALPAPRIAGYRGVADDRVLTATHPEENLLFVRGSQEQLDKVEKLIEALDVQDDQLKTFEYANCRLIPIHSQNATAIQSTLTQLDLQGQMIRVGQVSFVSFRLDQDDDKREQAEEVINRLKARQKDKAADTEEQSEDDAEETESAQQEAA